MGDGCGQAEIALLLEALEDKILYECMDRLPRECREKIRLVVNDLRAHGKDYIRAKYGL